jgi:subtilisin
MLCQLSYGGLNRRHDDSATSYRETVPLTRLTLLGVVLGGFVLAPAAHAAQAPEEVTWHGKQIHLYDAHHAGYRGSGVIVAVLDGWIDRSHPDFGGRVTSPADCSSGTCTATLGKDDHCGQDHGTHVAGTVTSSSLGVAPRATLMPIRVLTSDTSQDCAGNPAGVVAGINWAVSHGAKVLNLSLGPDVAGQDSAIQTAVNAAYASGAVVVFSAGNAGAGAAQAYSNALVVAATGPSGRLASYSQRGPGVSVAAPGGEPNGSSCTVSICVKSLYPGDQYAVAAGTSMAAPHVAGLAALLISAHPAWTPAQVMSRIRSTAHPLAGAGSGRVDAAAALGVKVGTSPPKPAPTRSRAPVVVIRPRTVTPAHTPSPTPRPMVTTPAPTPTPTPALTPTASPSPTTVAAPALPPAPDTRIPEPLAALAGMLVGIGAAGVLVLPRVLR